jgi:superfamily I DNA/RNA helicase
MQVELSSINRIGHDYWDVNVTTDSGDEIRTKMDLSAFNQPKPKMEKLAGIPFDFGYAVTCHKAQGSEAKRVFVLGQGFGTLDERRRWMYTATTRAREELYVIL